MDTPSSEVTEILREWSGGSDALGRILPLVLDEVRGLAQKALVNDVYLRLIGRETYLSVPSPIGSTKISFMRSIISSRNMLGSSLSQSARSMTVCAHSAGTVIISATPGGVRLSLLCATLCDLMRTGSLRKTNSVIRVMVPFLAVLSGCRAPEPIEPVVRLGDLLPKQPRREITIGTDLRINKDLATLTVDLQARETAGLSLHAAGDAGTLILNWRLAGEKKFHRSRQQTVVLNPDGEEHTYRVDLVGRYAWIGRVHELSLRTPSGELHVTEIAVDDFSSPYRELELARLLVPAFAGGELLEIPLPAGLPRRAVFEAHLGLSDELRQRGAGARFRVEAKQSGVESSWFETELEALPPDAPNRWHFIRQEVEIPESGSLVLETRVQAAGRDLSPEHAFWGNPRLVFAAEPQHPNLVVIAVDTLRADVVGAWGSPDGLTPEIDRLAARSIRFADHTVPAPWTLPSFASLMTGLQPQTHGAGDQGTDETGHSAIFRLAPELPTLAGVLSEHGFVTAGFINNTFLRPSFGLHDGFQEYRSFHHSDKAETIVDEALTWLDRHQHRPFFLFVHLFDPHLPYEPPESYCQQAAEWARRDVVQTLEDCVARVDFEEIEAPPDRAWIEALYRAEVAYTDSQIGRFLTALDALEIAQRTVVLFFSDHGEAFWERLEQEQELSYKTGADHGHSHYQELLRTPAALWTPELEAGVLEAPVETVDLFPTLLAFLGIDAPFHQGRDLRPLMAGAELAEPLRISDFILHGPKRWAARQGNWKLIVKPASEARAERELYDLVEDRGEIRNVAARHPEVVRSLHNAARRERIARRQVREDLRKAGPAPIARPAAEEMEQLRTLGYIE